MLCAGQVYESTLTINGQTGAPSAVALAITKPDGTLVTPAPTLSPGSQVGPDWVVVYDYTLPSAGLFKFAWTTTSPGTAPAPDYVNVRDFISIAGLGEVKAHLNITGTGSDDELTAYLMAAAELVESLVGVCVRRTFTDRIDSDCGPLVLPNRPVLTVTSVTSVYAGGPAWVTADLDVDQAAGIVGLASAGASFWWGPWNVVYEAGRSQIPERYIHAAKELVRHLWETQRGAAAPSVLAGEEVFTTSAGFAFSVPRRVTELLQADVVPSI